MKVETDIPAVHEIVNNLREEILSPGAEPFSTHLGLHYCLRIASSKELFVAVQKHGNRMVKGQYHMGNFLGLHIEIAATSLHTL